MGRRIYVVNPRDGLLEVIDASSPAAPVQVAGGSIDLVAAYANNRKFPRNASGGFVTCDNSGNCGDLGPEGLTFVPAGQSPTGKALLIVSNEVSSTTTIWQVE